MKIVLASVIFALYTLQAYGQRCKPGTKFATCDRRAWEKIGCYRDTSRPLSEMLLNDRDCRSKLHEPGYLLDWHKGMESIHSLACRCAQKARDKGYKAFGLQNYGECWSGPSAELNFGRDGRAVADRCIKNVEEPTECDKASDQECVGKRHANYIYKLVERD